MADFPSSIWVRKPMLDGFTTVDRAMTVLDQAREEVAAIETELGTVVASTGYNELVERLATRFSKSGHARGRLQPLRKWNREDNEFPSAPVLGWWDKAPEITPQYILTAISSVLSGANPTVTFPIAYTVKPDAVIARYVSPVNTPIVGSVVILEDQISTVDFDGRVQAYNSNKTAWGTPNRDYWIAYVAIGGTP